MIGLTEMRRLEKIAKKHNIDLRKIHGSNGEITYVFNGFNQPESKTGLDLIAAEYSKNPKRSSFLSRLDATYLNRAELAQASIRFTLAAVNRLLNFEFFEFRNRFDNSRIKSIDIEDPVEALKTAGALIATQIDILLTKSEK